MQIDLYNNQGFVKLIDILGDDQRVIWAARQSTKNQNKESNEEKDRKLIRYLLRNNHISPWEQVYVTFETKIPIFIARQLVRHKDIRINEQSARYSEVDEEFYIPLELYYQDKKNKQGSSSVHRLSEYLSEGIEESIDISFGCYSDLILSGVSREDARVVLPVAQMTNMVFTSSMRGLMHMLELRMHPHAQHQIQEFADGVYNLLLQSGKFNWTLEAFTDYNEAKNLFTKLLTKYDKNNEIELLKSFLEGLF
jgi:thymidylate synthase (FAD)